MGREDDMSLGERVDTVAAERADAQSPNRLRELAERDLAAAETTGGLSGKIAEVSARKTLAELATEDLDSKIKLDAVREGLGIPTELQQPAAESAKIPKGGLMERVDEVKKAREIMESAMHNVEDTIKGIEPIAGESPDDLLIRVRAAVHDAAFKEVNRPE